MATKTVAALLAQRRGDDVAMILPRTSADLVGYEREGSDVSNVQEALDDVAQLKETVASLQAQLQAVQDAVGDLDLSVYMKKANDQFTGGYFGTAVAADDGAVDLSKGSIFSAGVSGGTFEVSVSNAAGASCFTLVLTCAADCDVAWPDTMRWPDGEAPETPAGVSVFTFISPDAGATWYGTVNGTAFQAAG